MVIRFLAKISASGIIATVKRQKTPAIPTGIAKVLHSEPIASTIIVLLIREPVQNQAYSTLSHLKILFQATVTMIHFFIAR
jgi:hypothetical protein